MKRNVIVVSTNTQTRKDFKDVEVTTLADVKRLLDSAGIDYTDQAFYEGVSKAEYKSDDSILPTNMPFKGSVTNDLVFQLSNANKKIASGAVNPRRQRMFDQIKKYNLCKMIKDEFGLMYTSVSTDKLENFIENTVGFDDTGESYEKTAEQYNDFGSDYLLKKVVSALTKMGYIVCKPTDKAKPLSKSDISDILGK